MKHTFCAGKYTVAFYEDTGKLEVFYLGASWRTLTGDGLVLAMLQEVDSLKDQLTTKESELTYWKANHVRYFGNVQKEVMKNPTDELIKMYEKQLAAKEEELKEIAKIIDSHRAYIKPELEHMMEQLAEKDKELKAEQDIQWRLEAELATLKECIKPIEKVYENWRNADNKCICKYCHEIWQAIQQTMEEIKK